MPKKETLTDKVHDGILEMIIQTTQEEIVLNESKLVEHFGVSKAPVREALVRLCSEGVLKIIPRYGYVAINLTPKDEQDVINMRIFLETQALQENFCQLIKTHLGVLKEQIDRSVTGGDVTVWEMLKLNEEFHLLLASCGENRVLVRFLSESLQIQKRIYAKNWWRNKQSMQIKIEAAPHLAIYRALCDGDLERCLEALKQDIQMDELSMGSGK